MIEKWVKVNITGFSSEYEVSSIGNVRKVNQSSGVTYPKVWDVDTNHGYDRCVVLEDEQGSFITVPVSYIVACSFVEDFGTYNPLVYAENKEKSTDDVTKSDKKKGIAKPKKCVDLNSGAEFLSMKMCQNITGLSKRAIQDMTKGKKDEVNGWRIRFK